MNHLETSPHGFVILSGLSFAVALFVSWAGLRRYVLALGLYSYISELHSPGHIIQPGIGYCRLAKIRKVGLSNKIPKPWLPLPLRRRKVDGWS